MRLFVALDIPAEIRAGIGGVVRQLRARAGHDAGNAARWVAPESLHVTLKFLGEAGQERLPEIKAALSEVRAQPFDVQFQGMGVYPNPERARVFWIGVGAPISLEQLALSVDQALAKIGIAPEKRPYSPHLTLARAREGKEASQYLKRLQQQAGEDRIPAFGSMRATEFFLFESKTLPEGPRYTKLARFPLIS